jgi:hypothetical protein
MHARCWNINQLPIDYGFRPRLRGRLTLRRLTLRKETLGFRRAGLSPALSLLMSAFALPIPPADFSIHLQRRTERSSTAYTLRCTPRASVHGLAPLNLPRRPTRPVSYYAFFKGWLLLSQPPGCLCLPTSFTTEQLFWDLSCGSGLFPFSRRTLAPAVCLPDSPCWYSEFAMVW